MNKTMDSNKSSFVCLEMDSEEENNPLEKTWDQNFDQGCSRKSEVLNMTIFNENNSEINDNTSRQIKFPLLIMFLTFVLIFVLTVNFFSWSKVNYNYTVIEFKTNDIIIEMDE